jgi:LacI family transcriptional regulator
MRRPKAPTAMFTAQNFVTLGAVGALHDLDLHHRVAMVGFDEITLADAIEPGITTVPQHPLELGRAAARQLFARIEGSDEPFVHLVAPSTVIERGSGEIRPDQVEKTVEARFVPRESPSSPSAIRFIT